MHCKNEWWKQRNGARMARGWQNMPYTYEHPESMVQMYVDCSWVCVCVCIFHNSYAMPYHFMHSMRIKFPIESFRCNHNSFIKKTSENTQQTKTQTYAQRLWRSENTEKFCNKLNRLFEVSNENKLFKHLIQIEVEQKPVILLLLLLFWCSLQFNFYFFGIISHI